MNTRALDGPPEATTASGPAPCRLRKSPPRSSAPGPPVAVLAPKRHIRSSLKPPQLAQVVESGTQSATHSERLPTMSKAPRADEQALREPDSATTLLAVLQ